MKAKKKTAKKRAPKKEDLIYVKLDYMEAIQSKKDVLSSEMAVLQIAKTIKRYKVLRAKELALKLQMQTTMQDLKKNIKKLETTLPKIKLPNILKHEDEVIKQVQKPFSEEVKEVFEEDYDNELESQLEEIQSKLRELQAA